MADDVGKHPLGLLPAPEELDYLLDFGTNDSPHDHRALRVVQREACVDWPKVACPSKTPKAFVPHEDGGGGYSEADYPKQL
jgi:hypothetical protein